MINIIGVRFQQNGKMYHFDADAFTPAVGDYVIVNTARGIDLGEVLMSVNQIEEEQIKKPLSKMVRMATPQDIQHATDNRSRETEAFSICQRKIQEHRLEMKLVSVECMFDNSKILFYFTANGRVDFRALVKDLASVFKTRIELRQIGVRDEARMLGGLGPCGRPICCGSFLNDFQPVSIKMAKEQNLSLNPTKISGVCGRLMCCLKYEQDHYEQTRKRMPRIGREVVTPEGNGIVTDLNIVRETVTVRIAKGDENEVREFPLEQVSRPGFTVPVSKPAEADEDESDQPELTDSGLLDEELKSGVQEEVLQEYASAGEAFSPAKQPIIKSRKENRNPRMNPKERTADAGEGKKRSSRPPRAKEEQTEKSRASAAETENAATGSKETGRKGSRRLGQPVQRENPMRLRKEAEITGGNPVQSPAESTESVRTFPPQSPAPVARKKSSGWADALQKAMRAADAPSGKNIQE